MDSEKEWCDVCCIVNFQQDFPMHLRMAVISILLPCFRVYTVNLGGDGRNTMYSVVSQPMQKWVYFSSVGEYVGMLSAELEKIDKDANDMSVSVFDLKIWNPGDRTTVHENVLKVGRISSKNTTGDLIRRIEEMGTLGDHQLVWDFAGFEYHESLSYSCPLFMVEKEMVGEI